MNASWSNSSTESLEILKGAGLVKTPCIKIDIDLKWSKLIGRLQRERKRGLTPIYREQSKLDVETGI